MNKRLKVLAVAAAAHPEKGSEPGLGWGWVEVLSKYHDLWVITGEREGNREAIEKRFDQVPDLRERLKVHFIPRPDGPSIERIIPLLYYRRYRKWHQSANHLAVDLHRNVHFDLVHQLNMTGYREPGYLWKIDLPFVWGPVGGTANVPLRFASILGPRAFLYHLIKVAVNNLQLRFHKRVHKALRRTDAFVTSTSDTQFVFRRVLGKESTVINDNGPPLVNGYNITHQAQTNNYLSDGPIRLSWSGLHISRKALPIILRALSNFNNNDFLWHLDIIGAGPMTRKWQQLSIELGVDDRCTWHGWVTKETSVRIIANSDIFLFPSLHESTPAVIFEALSHGVPVICIDHCGQSDVITEECGIKIPVTSCQQVITRFAQAIQHLAINPQERKRLAKGTLNRVREFSWDRKAQAMVEVYENAIRHWRERAASG